MGKLEVGGLGRETERIVPGPVTHSTGDEESLDVWGFRDTAFRVNARGNVELTGDRYALSGKELPDLLPWVCRTLGLDIDVREVHASRYPTAVPASRVSGELLEELQKHLGDDAISLDPKLRLRHGHGHTQQEMYAIKYERLERVPDLVVFPADEDQVTALVEVASRHDPTIL